MPNYQKLRAQGMVVSILNYTLNSEGRLAGLKHLNRLSLVFAKMELDETKSNEGIVCNTEGYVREGVSSNVFMVTDDTIFTPPLKDCGVSDVLRSKVMSLASKVYGVDVMEKNFTPSDLLAADDVFFTNSLLGVCPAKKIDGRIYDVGDIVQCLMAAKFETDAVNEN